MVEGLTILLRDVDGSTSGLGEFDFTIPPRRDDTVVLANGTGGLNLAKVVDIEHSPVFTEARSTTERRHARCTVIVEMVEWGLDV